MADENTQGAELENQFEDEGGEDGGEGGGNGGGGEGEGDGQQSSPLDTFRFDGDDVPEELRGQTARELLNNFNTLRNYGRQLVQQMQTLQASQGNGGGQTQSTPKQEEVSFTEDDFGIGADPQRFAQKLDQFLSQKTQPFLVSIYQQQAQNAMQSVATNKEMFPYYNDYKDEILQAASQLPINQAADLRSWKFIHDQVVARHVDEIARKRASQPRPKPQHSERGAGGQAKNKKGGDLSAEEKALARIFGVSEDSVTATKKKRSGENG